MSEPDMKPADPAPAGWRSMDTLKELASKLPKGLRSDWDGTNHFELTSSDSDDYFWLMVGDGLCGCTCEDEFGKRFGLIMDVAAEVARLRDSGKL